MNSEQNKNQFEHRKPVYQELNFQIIAAITLMGVLGVSSITPAFPLLAKTLGINPKDVGLLITVYTLPNVLLGPIVGVAADKWGRKKVIFPALILFGITGTACALVRDFNLLLFLRSLQGIGCAPLLSLSITLIGDLYTGDKRVTAMGYSASVASVGTAIYPLIGGALATLGWFYPFILPILGIPTGLLVLLALKNPEPKGDRSLREYVKNAGQLLKDRQLFGLFITSTANFVLLYGAHVTYLPQIINDSFQAPPAVIGVIIASVSFAIIITAPQLGRLTQKYQPTTLVSFSFVLYTLGLLLIPFMPNIWFLLIPTTIFGIGLGIAFPSVQTLLANLAPKEYLATVISVNGTFAGLGQTIGPLSMGIIFGLGGISNVFYAASAFSILILFVFRYCTCR